MVAAYHVNWNGGLSSQLKDEFSLPGSNKIATLSKGMRAELALILALSFEPEVHILDEPGHYFGLSLLSTTGQIQGGVVRFR